LRSTSIRRAHGSAPPKPESETFTKAMNNSESEGRVPAGGTARAATESEMC
jgi:hypothetical protein